MFPSINLEKKERKLRSENDFRGETIKTKG